MKKFLLICCLSPLSIVAQNFHFSARAGLMGYQGDLKEISVGQSNIMGSIGARYDITEHLMARSYFAYGSLQADDKKGPPLMQLRNLNFQTKILDWELAGQYNILNLNDHWWTPYVFGGIGVFHFNPYTFEGDAKYFLKPLSTEGQGFLQGVPEYKLTQFSIPFGFGADYALNEDIRIGLELGYRKTFTDYIDDVSTVYADQTALLAARGQKAVDLAWRGDEVNGITYPPGGSIRGSSKYNDDYYYIALTFSIRYWFDKYKYTSGIPGGKREKRVGCPSTRY